MRTRVKTLVGRNLAGTVEEETIAAGLAVGLVAEMGRHESSR